MKYRIRSHGNKYMVQFSVWYRFFIWTPILVRERRVTEEELLNNFKFDPSAGELKIYVFEAEILAQHYIDARIKLDKEDSWWDKWI